MFGNWQAAFGLREMTVGCLQMQRLDVIDHGWNTGIFEVRLKPVTVFDNDCVLGKGRARPFFDFRGFDNIFQTVAITFANNSAFFHLVFKNIEFLQQNGSLNGIKTRVQADADIVILG